MNKKFIAISPEGAPFFYRMSSAIVVPEKSAGKIAEFLNSIGYWTKPGEVWTIHDNDSYTDERIDKQIKSFSKSLRIYRY